MRLHADYFVGCATHKMNRYGRQRPLRSRRVADGSRSAKRSWLTVPTSIGPSLRDSRSPKRSRRSWFCCGSHKRWKRTLQTWFARSWSAAGTGLSRVERSAVRHGRAAHMGRLIAEGGKPASIDPYGNWVWPSWGAKQSPTRRQRTLQRGVLSAIRLAGIPGYCRPLRPLRPSGSHRQRHQSQVQRGTKRTSRSCPLMNSPSSGASMGRSRAPAKPRARACSGAMRRRR